MEQSNEETQSTEETEENDRILERLDLEIIATGKRAKLTLMEMCEFSVKDLFAYARIYARANTKRGANTPRQATQKDIDNFYGGG